MYKLEYLPIARQDMIEIVQYISHDLSNPTAAEKLADELINAGDRITAMPYINPAYVPIKPLTHEYRKLLVENYIMFYWVDEETKTVTIARVIYSKRDYRHLLEL